jgi:hypothetical protein
VLKLFTTVLLFYLTGLLKLEFIQNPKPPTNDVGELITVLTKYYEYKAKVVRETRAKMSITDYIYIHENILRLPIIPTSNASERVLMLWLAMMSGKVTDGISPEVATAVLKIMFHETHDDCLIESHKPDHNPEAW